MNAVTYMNLETPQNNSPAAGPLVAKTSDGLNLSVQTYGDVGNDEILFVHGFGQSRLSWSKQTSSSLTERYRVVTFDLRGHGNSDKPDHAAAYANGEQWADDLHAVMETAGLRRPTLVLRLNERSLSRHLHSGAFSRNFERDVHRDRWPQ